MLERHYTLWVLDLIVRSRCWRFLTAVKWLVSDSLAVQIVAAVREIGAQVCVSLIPKSVCVYGGPEARRTI